jgi:cytochrome c553
MNTLGESCVSCHKKDRKNYPSELMKSTLVKLETALISGSNKDQGQQLGTLAVLACARCHGTHRIAYGAKKHLTKTVSFRELIKH